ncbi:MAG: hypothetical protein SH809_02875 [Rhodothermales bacterium]|nr:hypothetical protein [Rhodothermales bacterium]
MHRRTRRANANATAFALCMLVGFCSLTPAVAQQNFGRIEDTQTNIQSYFYHVEPGSATIQVYAFGKLQSPGVYIIEEGENLGFLLALSGGPVFATNPDWSQTPTVRLFRNRGGARTQIFESTMEEMLNTASETPLLQDGDVLTIDVEQRRRMNWRDVFTIISPILSTLLLVERLSR